MRKPIMAGNWKMFKTYDEALQFIYAVNEKLPSKNDVETIIFPPAILLVSLVKRQGENLKIGAQNMHYASEGAFTGEISPIMLKSVGVSYVLIGHNERRRYNYESDEDVNRKTKSAIENGLTPIICFGETEEQFLHHNTDDILKRQVKSALRNIKFDDVSNIIFAYEPIWAVGTGKTASAEIAEDKCKLIRTFVSEMYNEQVSSKVRILYGGSVNPENLAELVDQENIDGVLVGGASLNADKFVKMAEICKFSK